VGSGTTAAVAEKLGRRWIACDLGRFAVHTTRKRLLSIPEVKPFIVQNLGKYERQLWQVAEFGEQVDLEDPLLIKAISTNVAQYVTVKTFVEALRALVIERLEPHLLNAGRKLSDTEPFPYSRLTCEARKTVFNLVPCDSHLEERFARFKDSAGDVTAFAKLPEPFGFVIEYTDSAGNLRYYEPDFVVVLSDGNHYLVETKGLEDATVPHKDRAAQLWCENATLLTDTTWQYIKVPQKEFEKLEPTQFSDLLVFSNQ